MSTYYPVTIEYGTIPNGCASAGGFLPVIWVNGTRNGSTYSGAGYAGDTALCMAQARARYEAGCWGGDYRPTIEARDPAHTDDAQI